jgi:glycosyltransferase involved in cell wall biosynthesis
MMIVEIGNSSAIIPSPVAAVKGGRVRVTVISTVLNEGEAIRRLLDSLLAQTRRPDEMVIVDGGSRDNTVAVIQEYAARLPLRVLIEPCANISRGRNVAIAAATCEVIASVDAGVWLEPQWVERLITPLESANQRISESHREAARSANQQINESASSFQLPASSRRRRLLRPRRPDNI